MVSTSGRNIKAMDAPRDNAALPAVAAIGIIATMVLASIAMYWLLSAH